MNNRLIIIILSAVIAVLLVAGFFILRRDMPGPGPFGLMDDRMPIPGAMHMGKGGRYGKRLGGPFCDHNFLEKKLGLNQNQIKQIDELNKKFENDFFEVEKKLRPEREKLKNLLDNNTDLETIKKQLQKMESLNVEIHMIKIKQGREISLILTPDQMNMLHEERRMFFERMKERFDGGRR